MSSETEIDRVLRNLFPESDFQIEELEPEYEDTFRYLILSNISGKKSICVFVQFFSDHIYIERLGKCKLKGGETLDIIEEIAKQFNNISYISLEDDSTLKIFPEFDIWINLYIYKILTKGQSWYNSLEYYSDNYEQEKKDNAKFNTMTIKEFQKDVISRDIDKNKYIEHLKDLITIFPDIFSIKSKEIMTVSDFYNKIMEIIRSDEPDEKKVEWLEDDLNFVLDSKIVNYNAKKLEKRIKRNGGFKKRQTKRKKKRKSYSRKRTRV